MRVDKDPKLDKIDPYELICSHQNLLPNKEFGESSITSVKLKGKEDEHDWANASCAISNRRPKPQSHTKTKNPDHKRFQTGLG